jgi:hypothetical protein
MRQSLREGFCRKNLPNGPIDANGVDIEKSDPQGNLRWVLSLNGLLV